MIRLQPLSQANNILRTSQETAHQTKIYRLLLFSHFAKYKGGGGKGIFRFIKADDYSVTAENLCVLL
jgi:hypothetical protein